MLKQSGKNRLALPALIIAGAFVLGLALSGPGFAQQKSDQKLIKILVKEGDTLAELAKKYLGDENRWQEIARYNKIPSPYRLPAGSFIYIPKSWKAHKGKTGEDGIRRFSLLPLVGVLFPQSQLGPSFTAGLEAGYLTPWLRNRLLLTLEVDWFAPPREENSRDSRITGGIYRYEFNSHLVPFLFGARYLVPLGNEFTAFGGLNLGPAYARVETHAFGFTTTETDTLFAATAGAGLGKTVGPGDITLGISYQYAQADFISSGIQNLSGLFLRAGYFFSF